jgi:DNA-binding CsgD family transcriptional regulator/tetratricopeptide (TPR) repeat protein
VKLFLHSAQRLRPDFVLQAHDYDYLERICRLTAGMPLGIELAAGWIDVLTLEQIATELQRGIDILETDLRDIPERQRSVRATFESTWERLTDEEQRIFMRLSVFRGGFTVEAARVVASADVRALRKLINKALVQVLPEGRHGIHELLRQFGGEKLTASGQQAQLQASHADYFADFMAQRKQDIRTDRQLEALELIDPEFENVRVAWLHTVDQQVWAQFPKFLHSLWFYLDVRTRGQEGVELLEYAVKALQSTPSSDMTELALGRVLARLGWFYNDVGFIEKRAVACNEAIRILQEQNSPEDLLAALNEKQNGTDGRDQYDEILSLSREGFDIAQAIGDKSWEGRLRLFAGFLCHAQEDFAEAFQLAEEALVLFESLGDGWCLMTTYHLLGAIKVDSHEDEAAKQWFDKMQPLAEAFGHAWSRAGLYVSQGKIALHERNYAAARLGLRKGVKLAWDAGYQWVMPYLLIYFAQLFTGENDLERAVQTLATVHKQLPSVQADAITRTLRNELETKLGPVRFAAAWARGQERELSTLVAELLAEPANGLEGSPKVLKTGSPGQSVNQLLMEPLSPRELEVLGLIAEGLSNPEIAQKLYLSVGTIKVHTRNIYGKLGVNNRTEAVVQAQKLKLL